MNEKIDRDKLLNLEKDTLITLVEMYIDECESDNYSLYDKDSNYNFAKKIIDEECKIVDNFYFVKELLESKEDTRVEIGGYFFNQKAVELIINCRRGFFMNEYYNLTIEDFLNMVEESKSLTDVKNNLFKEYKEEYAFAWYKNFLEILKGIK